MRLSLPSAALLALLAVGAGCASPCMQIQTLLCECRFQTSDERRSCEQSAEAQEKLDPPTAAELTACDSLIPSCEQVLSGGDCQVLETVEGKRACGLAK